MRNKVFAIILAEAWIVAGAVPLFGAVSRPAPIPASPPPNECPRSESNAVSDGH